jgi:hypothetical protein
MAAAQRAPSANQPNNNPIAQNAAARQLILRGGMVGNAYQPPAIDMWQPLNPQLPASPGPGSVLTFYMRNVGLVKRLIVEISGTITGGAASTQFLTGAQAANANPGFGLANLISNVTFSDLGNNQRINTQGWHLIAVSSAKRRRVFGAAYTSDTPFGYGNKNTNVQSAPTTIAATVASPFRLFIEIPFVKNDTDLRGAIYADVTNAAAQVQITLNPNMFVSSTGDPSLAVYQSAGADLASLSNVTMQVYQNYLDQLPRINGLPILPQLDLGTAYLLNNTVSGLPVANQLNGAAFTNARTYESVAFYYDNNGTLNINGVDLTYLQLTSANFTNILNLSPKMSSLMSRNVIMDDFPAGMYYMDFRHRPIDTNQYGNMSLVIQPSAVGGSGAYFGYGWEAYGIIGLVNQGGSLPMGGG